MQIENITQGTLLASKVRVAGTFFTRLLGLMGTKALPDGEALILYPCSSIHTCFMNYPIDVVFLDEYYKVIKFYKEVKPFKFCIGARGARYVLELAPGSCMRAGIQIGDEIKIHGVMENG